ncbi:MAG: hypothetical protein RIT37_967, partial [Bacteroidota bacterium]
MMQVLDLLGYVREIPLVANSWFTFILCKLKDCFFVEAERSLKIG